MAILRFATNKPLEVALKDPAGRECSSQFGPQRMYHTTAGDTFYVPVHIGQKIDAMKLAAGDRIDIGKHQQPGGKLEWKVSRVDAKTHTGTGTSSAAGPAAANSTTEPPIAHSTLSRAMTSCLIASIDSLLTAQAYAKTKGLELKFNEEDVRALFINVATFVNTPQAEVRVNGGTTWAH